MVMLFKLLSMKPAMGVSISKPIFRTCISYGDKNRSIGFSARNQIITNYKNTVWGWKRLLGKKFKDPVVQKEIQSKAYEIGENKNGDVVVKVCKLVYDVVLMIFLYLLSIVLKGFLFEREESIFSRAAECHNAYKTEGGC